MNNVSDPIEFYNNVKKITTCSFLMEINRLKLIRIAKRFHPELTLFHFQKFYSNKKKFTPIYFIRNLIF